MVSSRNFLDYLHLLQRPGELFSFYHSSQATHKLEGVQAQLKLLMHKLKIECVTRWNSTYHMLARLVERKDAISLILSPTEIVPNLLPHEWLTAAEYVKTQQTVEEATELIFGSRYPSLSMVIPVLNLLCDQLADNKTNTLNDLRIALSA